MVLDPDWMPGARIIGASHRLHVRGPVRPKITYVTDRPAGACRPSSEVDVRQLLVLVVRREDSPVDCVHREVQLSRRVAAIGVVDDRSREGEPAVNHRDLVLATRDASDHDPRDRFKAGHITRTEAVRLPPARGLNLATQCYQRMDLGGLEGSGFPPELLLGGDVYVRNESAFGVG